MVNITSVEHLFKNGFKYFKLVCNSFRLINHKACVRLTALVCILAYIACVLVEGAFDVVSGSVLGGHGGLGHGKYGGQRGVTAVDMFPTEDCVGQTDRQTDRGTVVPMGPAREGGREGK